MPLKLAIICNKASNVLNNSHLPATEIEKYSGVNHSTIYRLRNHQIDKSDNFSRITLKSMLLLANYPNFDKVNERGDKVDPLKYEYYLTSAALSYNISLDRIKTKITELTYSATNLSELARELHVSRSHLSHMKSGLYRVTYQHVDVLARILNKWTELHNKGIIEADEQQKA